MRSSSQIVSTYILAPNIFYRLEALPVTQPVTALKGLSYWDVNLDNKSLSSSALGILLFIQKLTLIIKQIITANK